MPAKQADPAPRSENAHDCARPDTLTSSLLARLLAELAALPPEQRVALAALITPTPPTTAATKAAPPPDDRLPWERAQKEGETRT